MLLNNKGYEYHSSGSLSSGFLPSPLNNNTNSNTDYSNDSNNSNNNNNDNNDNINNSD